MFLFNEGLFPTTCLNCLGSISEAEADTCTDGRTRSSFRSRGYISSSPSFLVEKEKVCVPFPFILLSIGEQIEPH